MKMFWYICRLSLISERPLFEVELEIINVRVHRSFNSTPMVIVFKQVFPEHQGSGGSLLWKVHIWGDWSSHNSNLMFTHQTISTIHYVLIEWASILIYCSLGSRVNATMTTSIWALPTLCVPIIPHLLSHVWI